jgi:metal-sulfur cluster biosynthetic enzyme
MKIPSSVRKHLSRRRVYIQILAILLKLIKRIFLMVKFKKVYINMDYGDSDCARTGMLKGAVETVRGYLKARHKNIEINFTPHFNDKKLDVTAEVEVNITGFRVLKQLIMISIYSLKKTEVKKFLYELISKKISKKFSKKKKESMEK